MKQNNKKIMVIIIVSILIIYGLIVIILSKDESNIGDDPNNVGNSGEVTERKYEILTIDNYAMWEYYNNSWHKIDNLKDTEKLMNVYVNNNYYGEYYLKFVKSWNLFDSNDNYVNYDGEILAFSKNLNIKIKNISIEEINITDLVDIEDLLGFNISLDLLSTNEKIIVDLDSNGISDKVINISNLDYIDEVQENYFSLCFVILNGEKLELIKKIIDPEDVLVEPSYNLKYILNINNLNYSNIVLRKGYFSDAGKPTYEMYQYKDLKYLNVD